LAALYRLSKLKGYAFLGYNSNGNNAYFVRRESRNAKGQLNYTSGEDRLRKIKGLPVINVVTGKEETL
jgi:hypothetical protein